MTPLPEPVDPSALPPGLLGVLARRGEPVGGDVQRLVRRTPGRAKAIFGGVGLVFVAICAVLIGSGGDIRLIVGTTLLALLAVSALFITLTGATGELLLGHTWLARRSWRSRSGWQVLPVSKVRLVRWSQPTQAPSALSIVGRRGSVRLAQTVVGRDVISALAPWIAEAERHGAHVWPYAVSELGYRELTSEDVRRSGLGHRLWLLAYVVGLPLLILVLVLGLTLL